MNTRRFTSFGLVMLTYLGLVGPTMTTAQENRAETPMGFVELWLGKLDGGAVNLAGYSAPGTQHLFVANADGLVHPLEIGPPDWQWKWRDPVMDHHDGIVGLVAYYHPVTTTITSLSR